MLQATLRSSIHFDLNITPSLHLYDFIQCCEVAIEVCNVTTRTVSVSPKAIICELQPITIQDMVLPETANSNGMQNILDTANISDEIATEERER